MPTLTQITQSIMQDPDNQSFTSQGIEPLFAAPTTARINIVGCIQPLNMRNIKTNRDWAGIFGNKRDEYR